MKDSLSDKQWGFLNDLMNTIIPASEHMPNASSVVTAYIKKELKNPSRFENMLRLLEKIEKAAQTKHGEFFSALTKDEKETLLNAIEVNSPTIFQEFVNLVYSGYYTSTSIVELLGPDAGVPQPKGFSNPPFDPSIVDRVRTLGPNYRAI